MRRAIRTTTLMMSLALLLAAGTAFAATNLLGIRAEASGLFGEKAVPQGTAAFAECVFTNTSHRRANSLSSG